MLKRTNNFVSLVSKALQVNSNGEPPHIRLRQEAEDADTTYRVAVRRLDRQRLGLEERIEDTLKKLQRWELERLRAVKTGTFEYISLEHSLTGILQLCFSTRVHSATCQNL